MRFLSIERGHVVVDLWPDDLALLTKVCQELKIGDLDEATMTTVDAMTAAFEAAQIALWLEGEIPGCGSERVTLEALRKAGSVGAAMEAAL